jgi:hypothetical protein
MIQGLEAIDVGQQDGVVVAGVATGLRVAPL